MLHSVQHDRLWSYLRPSIQYVGRAEHIWAPFPYPKPITPNCKVAYIGDVSAADVGDLRESPALDIIQLLEGLGALVSFHDPFVTSLRDMGLEAPFADLTEELLAAADCVVIATNHSSYDWAWVQHHAPRIVDTRRVHQSKQAMEVAF